MILVAKRFTLIYLLRNYLRKINLYWRKYAEEKTNHLYFFFVFILLNFPPKIFFYNKNKI